MYPFLSTVKTNLVEHLAEVLSQKQNKSVSSPVSFTLSLNLHPQKATLHVVSLLNVTTQLQNVAEAEDEV